MRNRRVGGFKVAGEVEISNTLALINEDQRSTQLCLQ